MRLKTGLKLERPEQVIDYLGMMGDAVDNIPGLPGVGDKTAKKFLKEFGSMENLLANTDKLKGKLKDKIEAKKFELPESSDKKFNQGLKLVDLVAESNSEDELSLKFKVFNDEGKEVQKYYGIMKDGSELPAWVTVDSKTGKARQTIATTDHFYQQYKHAL